MKIPEGVSIDEEVYHSDRVVCQLNKSLYGLKQAPRCWNKKFNDFLMKFNMVQSEADQCIYIGEIEKKVYLALFVDDGLAACKSSRVLDKMIECLKGTFEITIGDASKFIGLQIVRNRHDKTMFIHQSEYVEQILEKFKMIDAKVVSILAGLHAVLSPVENEGEIDNRSPYQEAVGSLMFLTVVSRPDLAFAVKKF